jgi:hypothetical protein
MAQIECKHCGLWTPYPAQESGRVVFSDGSGMNLELIERWQAPNIPEDRLSFVVSAYDGLIQITGKDAHQLYKKLTGREWPEA